VHGRLTFCGEIDEAAAKRIRSADRSYHIALPTQSARRAGNLAELAWARLRRGESSDAAALAPIYLRDPAGQKLPAD
jgi:tRNA A37 threonylcarbamoyladenosine modification protein TsaB